MFGRKAKTPPEQGREGRQVRRDGAPRPAFSYYTSRPSEPNMGARQTGRQEPVVAGQGRHLPRWAAQTPFWLLLTLAAVCLVKILWLSSDAKVVVLGNSSVAANYLQSTSVYAAAAQRILASSLTNHTKITVNLGDAAAALQREFPELQTVSLDVPLVSSRPIVYLQVTQPSIVLQTASGNYALNKSGVVLARLRSLPADTPVVVAQAGAAPQPGKQYLPGSTVSFVQTLAYQFAAAHLTISTFLLPTGSPYELDVHLEGQPYIIRCNLEADALTQSGAAIAVIQRLSGGTPAQYIDVRTPGRAYYK